MVNSVATGEWLSYTRDLTFLRRPKGRRTNVRDVTCGGKQRRRCLSQVG